MIFHQFTYSNDSTRSVQSIRSLRRLYPTVPIYLWEDDRAPLDPSLDYMDAIIRPTSFRRIGNLNGPECVLGMRECYRVGYEEHSDARCHIKFDPDSIMLHTTQMDELISDQVYFFTPAMSKSYVHGWFQYHSREFHEDYLAVKDIRAMCRQPSWNEDLVHWESATVLARGREVRDFTWPEERISRFYEYGKGEFSDWFQFSALMMGFIARGAPGYTAPHQYVADTMRSFLDEFLAEFTAPENA